MKTLSVRHFSPPSPIVTLTDALPTLNVDMRKVLPIDEHKESIQLPKGIKSGRDWGVGPEEIVF